MFINQSNYLSCHFQESQAWLSSISMVVHFVETTKDNKIFNLGWSEAPESVCSHQNQWTNFQRC